VFLFFNTKGSKDFTKVTKGFSLLKKSPPALYFDMLSICFGVAKLYYKKKPSYAKASEGEGGLYWSRTSDPYPVKVML
jgi:hypothetical protein